MSVGFICPAPLAYAYSDKDTTIWALEIGNCAVPCPSIQITEKEFQMQADVFTYVVLLTSFITVVMLFKMAQRFYIRKMFVVGFFLFAIVALVFAYQNRNNGVVCSGEGHYVKQAPLCVFQAAVFVFSIIWVQCWSVILAVDAYLHIVNKLNPQHINWRRKAYFGVGFGISLVCTIIPLGANNLGFDPYANIPFCLFLFSDHTEYFWATLFVPFCMLNLVCSLITVAGAVKIQRVFVLSKSLATRHQSHEGGEEDGPSTRGSSDDMFLSGHGEDLGSSFGGSVGATTNRQDDVLSAFHTPNRIIATDMSVVSDRDVSVMSPDTLQVPLIDQLFADPYLFNEQEERESIGAYAYARHHTKSVDPECLTNVTEDFHQTSSDRQPASGVRSTSGNKNGMSTLSRDSKLEDPSLTDSKLSLNWFRLWSHGSGECVDDSTTIQGRKISHWEYLIRKTVKYNGRTMLFLVMFCLTTLFVAPILIYLQYVKYDIYMDSGDKFVECLVEASIQCDIQTQSGVDECGKELCGEHPGRRPNVVEMMSIIIWIAGYGIIPGLVFGTYA